MVTVSDIYKLIDNAAPFSSAMSFDNVGILVGDGCAAVTRALLCLDITPAVVEEAAAMNANLIISHHPVIFNPMKQLAASSVPYLLARHGINAICAHTNIDRSPICGTNVALGELLSLRNVHPNEQFGDEVVLFSGELPTPLPPVDFAAYVKERLGLTALPAVLGERDVQTVYYCSGAGGDFLSYAQTCGADAYLTGELHHHQAIEAATTGMTVLAAGHYETEKPIAAHLAAYLRRQCKEISFLLSKNETAPLSVL